MRSIRDILPGFSRVLTASLLLTVLSAGGAASALAASPTGWATASLRSTQAQGLLTARDAAQPTKPMRRIAYAQALARLADLRGGQPETAWKRATKARALPDAAAGSVGARAVELGWMSQQAGAFAPESPITGDEAARGVVAVMGLRPDAVAFAKALRAEIPGARTGYELRAYQVFVRGLGMRYNHPQGQEKYEVSPSDPMSSAHVAYMLDRAAKADDWRVESVRQSYAAFDLPVLGPNETKLLQTAVSLVGQPYVWAGETEGIQPEGHGGFDCSGFTWRVLNGSKLPASVLPPVGERTSMTMSAIPARSRIKTIEALRPGDMVFFGYKGKRSKPAENFHVGVSLGNGWVAHSSGGNGGVTIQHLDGWWAEQFSWGRRVLRTR